MNLQSPNSRIQIDDSELKIQDMCRRHLENADRHFSPFTDQKNDLINLENDG